MNRSFMFRVSLTGCLLLLCSVVGAEPETASDFDRTAWLQVHLPREMTVEGNQLRLGQISVIRGAPQQIVAAAGEIPLGRFSVPGQSVVLDRATLLSRLASSGIATDQVRLTGADAVTVRRQQEIVEVEDFVGIGQQFLRQLASLRSVCEIIPVSKPKALVLSGQPQDIQLRPELVRGAVRGHATVRVGVVVDGREVGTRDISFRLRYERHRVVASEPLAEGTILTPENVRIESVVADQPEPPGWTPPYGWVVRRTIAADAEIHESMLDTTHATVLVRRNETVLIRMERPGILVTAMGTSLQEGRTGELVKVRNADSSRIIVCKVTADGSVEPVM